MVVRLTLVVLVAVVDSLFDEPNWLQEQPDWPPAVCTGKWEHRHQVIEAKGSTVALEHC